MISLDNSLDTPVHLDAECSSLLRACRYVHMYELTKRFVVPWSKGTGCSIATLVGYKRTAQDAQMMLSHVRQLT